MKCPILFSGKNKNKLPSHYILEESNFSSGNVRLCVLDILKEKWLN